MTLYEEMVDALQKLEAEKFLYSASGLPFGLNFSTVDILLNQKLIVIREGIDMSDPDVFKNAGYN